MLTANGSNDSTYLLIAKATFSGSHHFVQDRQIYTPFTINSKRHEGILIEQTFAIAASRLPTNDPSVLASELFPKALLEDLVAPYLTHHDNEACRASVVLSRAMRHMAKMKGDYRRDRMIALGEKLSGSLCAGPLEMYYTAVDVNLENLDRKLPPTVKRIYKEMRLVEEIVKTVF
jgi:hypothetical protein